MGVRSVVKCTVGIRLLGDVEHRTSISGSLDVNLMFSRMRLEKQNVY